MKRHIVCLTFDHDHLSGFIARGLTSPTAISRGEYDMVVIPRLVALLGHGIQYDSSLMGHDYDCYYARQDDVAELKKPFVRGRETRLVEMPISWSLDDYPHFEYMRNPNGSIQAGLMNANNVLENFVDDFTYMTEVCPDFGILTYTFHPHVIGRGHRMMMLERLIKSVAASGAVFMTMEHAMREWLTRKQTVKAAE